MMKFTAHWWSVKHNQLLLTTFFWWQNKRDISPFLKTPFKALVFYVKSFVVFVLKVVLPPGSPEMAGMAPNQQYFILDEDDCPLSILMHHPPNEGIVFLILFCSTKKEIVNEVIETIWLLLLHSFTSVALYSLSSLYTFIFLSLNI